MFCFEKGYVFGISSDGISSITFWTSGKVEGALDPVHRKTFLLIYLLLLLWFLGICYIGHIIFYGERRNYKPVVHI